MKKISFIFIALIILFTGCSNNDCPKIDEYVWSMTTVQSMEENGQAVAFASGQSSTLEDAVEIDMVCKAENGKLILTDKTNDHIYTGTYKLINEQLNLASYEVTIGNTKGIAVTAMTIYNNEDQDITLIINLNDYTLNFFSAAE